MQPVSELKQQLFLTGEINPDRILEFSCGHVIPSSNILPIALSHDPEGKPLDFTYASRNDRSMLESLSSLLLNLVKVIPSGMVCFLPSYQYESVVFNHLSTTGARAKLMSHKQLFREPKTASMVDSVLESYSRAARSSGGALLFSVVGGKMSEGINFSDELGRCVVMVGLPYPNKHSPELKEKMNYLNQHSPCDKEGVSPGQIHYENLCMKAVNQSIGRAIRHKRDYSCILLADRRYERDSVVKKLPGWLSPHITKHNQFPTAREQIVGFFKKLNSQTY